MIYIYFGIPLAIIIIADIRAKKGKRSVIMLTIMLAAQIIFNSVAILNSLDKNDNNTILIGSALTVFQIICYFVAMYITNKNAEKAKQKKNKETEKEGNTL